MMNVVDSSGWLEYFEGNANAIFFVSAITDTENLLVPTICIYEVFKRMIPQRGEQEALRAVAVMSQGNLVNLDRQIAMLGSKISIETHLPMADSIILATARAHDATLWTEDEHFIGLEGVQFVKKS